MAPTSVYSASSNPQCIYSNSADLVREHQYLFETLWEKALPADQRIKQIESGLEPEKIELIQDPRKSIALAFEIMKRTSKELLILFASPRSFILGYGLGVMGVYGDMSERGVSIRLLVPRGSEIDNEVAKTRALHPSIDVRVSDADLNTNVTILISDRKEFMNWQLKDDTLPDPYEASGVATYSSIQTLASSYATIFDNLWKITEFTENLKAANIELKNSETSMKEFIDIAAHELRTPVQPIIGLAEILRARTRDPEWSTLLDAILRNADRLNRLQQNILDVTKIENHLIRYEKEEFNIDELITQLLQEEEKNVVDQARPQIHLDLHSNSKVVGDRQRISQVILNLIGNSLKFAKGNIKVSSILQRGEAVVSVIDDGPGIDPEIMPKLFSKFVTKSSTGTGLGLFISKSVVEAHGGRIWAKNDNRGGGAVFCFGLPAASADTVKKVQE
jgi:signal transduction histidine kinase